jgi:hypothetical protein
VRDNRSDELAGERRGRLVAFVLGKVALEDRVGGALAEVGLEYLRLGQPINTLSGGESQRLKLVSHLAESAAVSKPTATDIGRLSSRNTREEVKKWLAERNAASGLKACSTARSLTGSLDDKRTGDTRFATVADFLESIPTTCPHDLFRREGDDLVHVKRVPAGVGVSYGHIYTTDRETTLGLVPLGYADGVSRAGGNLGPVLAAGRSRTVAGRVCMDQFVLDLGDDDVAVGDEVVLFGPGDDGGPTAQDWADAQALYASHLAVHIKLKAFRMEQAKSHRVEGVYIIITKQYQWVQDLVVEAQMEHSP